MPEDEPNQPQSPATPNGSRPSSSAHQPAVASPLPSLTPTKMKPTLAHPQGPRSQSLDPTTVPTAVDPRDRPGSSRTKVVNLPLTTDLSPSSSVSQRTPTSPTRARTLPTTTTTTNNEAESSLPPYRSPEPVYEPPEEHPEGFVPGVVEEHAADDFSTPPRSTPPASGYASPAEGNREIDVSRWQADVRPGYDGPDPAEMDSIPEDVGPQLGPGMTARRVLAKIHEHRLMRVSDLNIPPRKAVTNNTTGVNSSPIATTRPLSVNPLSPTTTGSGPTSASSQPTGTLDYDHIRTEQDVNRALPGGMNGLDDWYYCWKCCHWRKIEFGGQDKLWISNGRVCTAAEDKAPTGYDLAPQVDQPELDDFDAIRGQNYVRDLENAHAFGDASTRRHFHELKGEDRPPSAQTLERIDLGEDAVRFPHTIPGMEVNESWFQRDQDTGMTRLHLSCGTKEFIKSETGPVAGQIPPALLKAFIQEKKANPNVGASPTESVTQALQLLMTLLANPLFKGQRGWVKLENPKFQAKIGSTILSSLMLYMIGFGCRDKQTGLEVGPYSLSSEVSEEQLLQQDQYMMRTWVELALTLQGWRDELSTYSKTLPEGIPIKVTYLDQLVNPNTLDRKTIPTFDVDSLTDLGMSKYDTAEMIPIQYKWQSDCDRKRLPKYLGAIERLSKFPLSGADDLKILVATERSLGRYTDNDLQKAYEKIGYTRSYADTIMVEAHEAPDEEILRMHRVAVQSVSDPADKTAMDQALELIGRSRMNGTMRRMGRSGQSLMSVEEAFAALSAPSDSIDDGLIMQYEMAVSEYPGKMDHYRSCLEIIAKSGGDERQGLKRYLETGSKDVEVEKRNDIPAGLHNIGNTCYLNSILQYLYSIKPLREAVLSFQQDSTPVKPEVERSKRFVHQLRLLFLQLYKTEAAAVRPDEELAYLAITRPEYDELIEPVEEHGSLIDNLPTVGSPSSTMVNTPVNSRPSSPLPRSPAASRSSVLGKRVSQDRESASPGERPKKSDGFEKLAELDDVDYDTVMVEHSEETKPEPAHHEFAEDSSSIAIPSSEPSTAADMDIDGLKLKSPEPELQNPVDTFEPPAGPPPLPPRPRRASKGTLNAGLKFGLQQDSAEVLINVLSQLETAFEPPKNDDGSKGHNIIAELFSCEYRQQLIYKTAEGIVDAQTPVNSVFVHPIIGVEEEGKDLYDCLGELYLGGADIEYEGKKGHMMDLMDKFPPMLYIQMRRSQYDPVTRRERKTNTHIPFDQILAMDRFLVEADAERREKSIEITRDMTRLRSRLHDLRKEAPLSLPTTFDHLHDALKRLREDHADLEITPDLLDVLKDDKKDVEREIKEIQDAIPALKAKLESLWADQRQFEYELVSVFMHRGKTSGAGHYWTYQSHLPDHPGRFFKYNDETVTEVTADEVLQDRTGSDANPALLCYVRKGKDLVDTLHREVYERELEGSGTSDVEMITPGGPEQGDIEMAEERDLTTGGIEKPLIDFGDDLTESDNKKGSAKAEASLIDLDWDEKP